MKLTSPEDEEAQAATYSRDRGRCSSWIMGIAHNIAVDEIRRRKARPQSVYDDNSESSLFQNLPDASDQPDDLAIGRIQRQIIIEELHKLPDDQRVVIEMSYFGGFSQLQIANMTGEPLGTIKTRARLGLQRLRASLGAQGLWLDNT